MNWTLSLLAQETSDNGEFGADINELIERSKELSHAAGSTNILLLCYLVAAVLFILSLGGLSKHETARRGNTFGVCGILLAIFATMFYAYIRGGHISIWIALAIGSAIGIFMAIRVQMTSMPQLVAILHSFVGLAAVFVGLSNQLSPAHMPLADEKLIHMIEIFLGVFIGGITFTGSVIAFGKLDGKISSKPLMIPHRHLVNLGMIIACLLLGVWFVQTESMIPLFLMTFISFVVGAHMVMAIGGADMPVVVSMLNSYSGWAAAATGFLLKNDLLIITGALVGSSGAILSYIMCHAMNRSFISVILGGFGTGSGTASSTSSQASTENLTYNEVQSDEVAQLLKDAKNVIIVPGYGMAVAQAQHPIREITEVLKKNGTTTRFAIHPVAGRLPGHMNVLLAEARVPYDVVLEMEEINEDFPETDVVLVIGANDIVNPSAETDPGSPIYGMPVLQAWKSSQVVILKRSMGTGYSGIDNPLFYNENSAMLFGDAKTSVDNILQTLRS